MNSFVKNYNCRKVLERDLPKLVLVTYTIPRALLILLMGSFITLLTTSCYQIKHGKASISKVLTISKPANE